MAFSILSLVPAPAQPAGSTKKVTIAERFSASISAELLKRLCPPNRPPCSVQDFPSALKDALLDEDIQAETRPASAQKYDPPGDDELSFVNSGDRDDAITERIRAGYPNLKDQLVLVTIAERGPYLIAAAYVFSPANGGGSLKRVGRHVVGSEDATESLLKDTWPVCFAKSIKRFVEGGQEESERPCDRPASQAPLPPRPEKAAALNPKPQTGMLDDVDSRRPGIKIVPAQPQRANRQPSQSKPAGATSPPADRFAAVPNIVRPGMPNPGVRDQIDPSPPLARLLEDVLFYGFMWLPKDENRIKIAFRTLWQRPDLVDCLRALRGTQAEAENQLIRELRGAWPVETKELADNQLQIRVGKIPDSNSRTVRGCMPPRQSFMFVFDFTPYSAFENLELPVAKSYVEPSGLRGVFQPKWRIPSAIEAFALASLFFDWMKDPQYPQSAVFWAKLDDDPGVFSLKRAPNGTMLIDFELEKEIARSQRRADLLRVRN